MARTGGIFTVETSREMLQAFRSLKSSGLLTPGVIQKLIRGGPDFKETPKLFTNASGDTCPPYACMQITGTEVVGGQVFLTVGKPTDAAGADGAYIFNWHYPVEDGAQGTAQKHRILRARANGVDTVTSGERWQPVVDDWTIEQSDSGIFTMCGDDQPATDVFTDPIVKIALNGAGGGSGKIFFEVDSASTAGASSPYAGFTLLQVTVILEPCDQDIETAEVVDWSSCLANAEELAALVGREGWAFRARGRQSLADTAEVGDKTPCHWALDGLCCP